MAEWFNKPVSKWFIATITLLALFTAIHILLNHYKWQLPIKDINKPILITGIIANIPQTTNYVSKFTFALEQINKHTIHTKLQLSWYDAPHAVHSGERWQFVARLKPPHGLHNPVGFNYRRWLQQQHIQATGYITHSTNNKLLGNSHQFLINQLREYLIHEITQLIKNSSLANIIIALCLGYRGGFSQQQWQVFQYTGTSHLVAISGLHISLVASSVFIVAGFMWRHSRLSTLIPAQRVAAIIAILSAMTYTALSGFGLPAIRADIMLTVMLSALLVPLFMSLLDRIIIALAIILIINPIAIFSASLILSFAAVIAIAFALTRRLALSRFQQWYRTHIAITLLLTPLCLWYFQQTSLISLLINMIAIPWIGLIITPLSLLSCVALLIHQPTGILLLHLTCSALSPLWLLMQWSASLHWVVWQHHITTWVMLTSLLATAILLLPRGIPGRNLAWILLLPVFFWHPSRPSVNTVWLTILDVGQGLATVLQTTHHLMLYDTGAANRYFDAGRQIILPYLRYLGYQRIDKIMISHGDNDHSGGAHSVLATLPVSQILTSIPELFPHAEHCWQGQHWQWDGVSFRVLYPPQGQHYLDNNSSCVLKVTAGKQSLLLVGDIERLGENQLLANNPLTALQANVLIAPHHGSRTSSSPAFVKAVKPEIVIFSTGYLNRYHFPAKSILWRYKHIDAQTYNTAITGAIQVRLSAKGMLRLHPFW